MNKTEKLRELLAKYMHQHTQFLCNIDWGDLDEDCLDDMFCSASQILQACKDSGLKFVPKELNIGGAINPYRDSSFFLAVAFDTGKFATRDAIKSQIEEIES